MKFRIILFLNVLCVINAYKFLLVFPIAIRSLTSLGEGITRHLLNAGHEVTFVTSFPKNKPVKNLREIDISSFVDLLNQDAMLNMSYAMSHREETSGLKHLLDACMEINIDTLKHPNVKKLLDDTKEKFDAVIVDLFESELLSGLAALYECPMIWSYSLGPHWSVLRLLDGATNPSFTPDLQTSFNQVPLTFSERVQELWFRIQWYYYKYSTTMPLEEAAYKELLGPLFSKRARTLPAYEDVIYNASLVLANENYALGNMPSTPQNFKFVGGFYIEHPAQPLPKDIQEMMDNAKHGVVYFSMGSTYKSKDMPDSIKHDLLQMFGSLKQTVIWKYEEDDLKNLPNNIHIMKWAPQSSILAHPNCLFFISHGGHLSSTEAIHFGVPVIGIPIFLDQFRNIKKATNKGYAIKVDLTYDLAKNLKVAIDEMLTNSNYRHVVKRLSAVYHARPVQPGLELVYWVEHVVNTQGAPHLRSPALMVPWYQKLYLDLAALILIPLVILLVAVKWMIFVKRLDKPNLSKKIN